MGAALIASTLPNFTVAQKAEKSTKWFEARFHNFLVVKMGRNNVLQRGLPDPNKIKAKREGGFDTVHSRQERRVDSANNEFLPFLCSSIIARSNFDIFVSLMH
eukprot:GHVO01062321.1.p1 GENE.GHVO01062321.1~~GHVO01062321.1.p1  ORF type:complete len:103 (+),score=1.28 GHVO01062321.1:14-322(+)